MSHLQDSCWDGSEFSIDCILAPDKPKIALYYSESNFYLKEKCLWKKGKDFDYTNNVSVECKTVNICLA